MLKDINSEALTVCVDRDVKQWFKNESKRRSVTNGKLFEYACSLLWAESKLTKTTGKEVANG